MRGIMNGLNNIHEKNYIHRDLKPENIQLAPKLEIKSLANQLKIKDLNITNIEGDVYYFDQGQYNIKSGKATYTTKKIPFVLDKMQKLHKATTKSPIYWLNIFFGLSLLFFVISAFWMFMPSTTVFKRGIYFSFLGFIMTIIILFL